jgi:hypothetical protein
VLAWSPSPSQQSAPELGARSGGRRDRPGRRPALLASVEPDDWYGVWQAVIVRVGVAMVPEHVEHRQTKRRLLAAETERRRQRPAAAETE